MSSKNARMRALEVAHNNGIRAETEVVQAAARLRDAKDKVVQAENDLRVAEDLLEAASLTYDLLAEPDPLAEDD